MVIDGVSEYAAYLAEQELRLWGKVYEAARAEVRQGAAPSVPLNIVYINTRAVIAQLAGDRTEERRLRDLSSALRIEHSQPSLRERGR